MPCSTAVGRWGSTLAYRHPLILDVTGLVASRGADPGIRASRDSGCERWAVVEGRRAVRQELLRPGPIPGPPLHRDRPPHRPGHGRPGHLRHYRRLAARPHRHPGATTGQAPASRRPPTRNDPAGHPPRSPARSPPPTLPGRATPSTGRTGAAATKPAPAGTTSHTPHPRRRIRPQLGGLSVKLRHGRALEAKVYRGSPRMLDVVGRARGRLESWDKCSFPVNRLARGLLTCQAGVRCAS